MSDGNTDAPGTFIVLLPLRVSEVAFSTQSRCGLVWFALDLLSTWQLDAEEVVEEGEQKAGTEESSSLI